MRTIAACGNNCSVCPRYTAITDKELHKVAVLWKSIGYRDVVVSNEEIKCKGCTINNFCRYNIVKCSTERGISNCGMCEDFPCTVIKETFDKTLKFEPKCKRVCSDEEYRILEEAFFNKKENLNKYNKEIK
ncbi:DUF3795 domain-containing protein [Clostridium uliginosum]|uniref:DUF3795 domain-containing protein n=1 Tax=Clostridium uliginosum TaxID=119641 RepID=A0A1I1NN54_9CLOT|nr:DUF3795 domain-containing protein [Clostridium uliginosum]SFC99114.1 Protein of unknown function [Clostridium uliginosum]